jgi:hypothetical protein
MFNIFLCHGADPGTKGKTENIVRYAKHGFAEHLIFKDIYSFNEDCIAWLDRTANTKSMIQQKGYQLRYSPSKENTSYQYPKNLCKASVMYRKRSIG